MEKGFSGRDLVGKVIMEAGDAVIWWTAFGAIAQAVGAVATFGAIALSLWIVISERAIRAKGSATIYAIFDGDGSPGRYVVGIDVLNTGFRKFHVSSVGWRTGWISFRPSVLQYRYAVQKTEGFTNNVDPHVVEPGRSQTFYVSVSIFKVTGMQDAGEHLFSRKVPILGKAPIRAVVNITGRKPLIVRVSRELEKFLRTKQHPDFVG